MTKMIYTMEQSGERYDVIDDLHESKNETYDTNVQRASICDNHLAFASPVPMQKGYLFDVSAFYCFNGILNAFGIHKNYDDEMAKEAECNNNKMHGNDGFADERISLILYNVICVHCVFYVYTSSIV